MRTTYDCGVVPLTGRRLSRYARYLVVVTEDETYTHLPAFFACNIADNRWPFLDFAETVESTDFDFRPTDAVVNFFEEDPTFEAMELTTTRQLYLAHADAVTFSVKTAFVPERRVVIFCDVFAFTLNCAGATDDAKARTPWAPAAAVAKVISGIVTSHPSEPCASAVHRVHVIAPCVPPSVRAKFSAFVWKSVVAATSGVAP